MRPFKVHNSEFKITPLAPDDLAFIRALADEHSVGLADRCARYRRRVSLRRSTVAAFAVVVTVTAFILPPSNGTFVDGSLQCCTADACQRVNVTLTKI